MIINIVGICGLKIVKKKLILLFISKWSLQNKVSVVVFG